MTSTVQQQRQRHIGGARKGERSVLHFDRWDLRRRQGDEQEQSLCARIVVAGYA